jgi:L-amino acid N-acyltransferase YncA
MSDIVTGTVSGMVDTSTLTRDIADVRRETALESGNIRRDVALESHRVSEEASRDASNFFIAETAAANQTAKEQAYATASTDAKVIAGFASVSKEASLQAAIAQVAASLESSKVASAIALGQHNLSTQIAAEGNATRALLQATEIANLRSTATERYSKLIELEADRKHSDREYDRLNNSLQQNQFASLQSQLQAMNSDLQTTKQGVVNFGSMGAGAGTQSSTSNVVR